MAPAIGMKKIVEIYAREHNLIEKDSVYHCFAQTLTESTESPIMHHKNRVTNEKKKIKHRQSNSFFSSWQKL